MTGGRWVAVCASSEVAEGSNRAYSVDGRSVLLCRTAAGLFAVENRCTHQLAALEGGKVRGVHLFCPKHGARFDMRTGKANALAKTPIATFAVREEGDQIEVQMPEGEGDN